MASQKDISILIVDDEEHIRQLLATCLGNDYACVTAASADEATDLLALSRFNLVMTDITMPGASGIELCQYVQKASPDTVAIVVSGMTDIQYAIKAMRHGAFDYVTKPFDLTQVLMTVERALRYQALVVAKHSYEQSLEETVRRRTKELRTLNENLNQMLEALYQNYRATLRALARALEARDVETRGHSDRVVAYSLRLGRELGLPHNDLIALEQGALLHDIGKIGVRDSILLKPGPLTAEEWVEMREHINHGLRIISDIDFLKGAGAVVGQHHEKYNGSGYPNGLRGDQIHINARIFAVADAFDAITSNRPYRAATSYAHARKEIIAHVGVHFDPGVVTAFLRVSEDEWLDIRTTAESDGDYTERVIDKREIRSFIISLKRSSGRTGALNLNAISA
ncbi:MAG TPA: HD domain-containing phosphohydrolase [Blastocatellia bacterium]|nr:HD domain-containing phosphohydrolase [Blastocatellia bacterium]